MLNLLVKVHYKYLKFLEFATLKKELTEIKRNEKHATKEKNGRKVFYNTVDNKIKKEGTHSKQENESNSNKFFNAYS